MTDRVVEPSEIIVDRENPTRENISHVNPWLRFLARFFDYSLFFLVLWSLRHFFHGNFPFGKYEYFIPFEYFVWIPVEALLLWAFGTTPGKFLLGTKLLWKGKKKPDYLTALKRSFSVWFRGFGMGIPVINFFCLLVAYQKLKLFRITSWDRDDQVLVTHHPIGSWRVWVSLIVIVSSLFFYYSDKNKALKPDRSASGRVL